MKTQAVALVERGRASDLREGDRDAIDPIPMGQDQAREQAFESNR